MSDDAASLQAYNNELVKCLEELRGKRADLEEQIKGEEEERAGVQNDLHILTERLSRLSESLARKIATRAHYDKTIADTEAAYSKILESSHTLLQVLKRTVPGPGPS